jgi:hypothetical protein
MEPTKQLSKTNQFDEFIQYKALSAKFEGPFGLLTGDLLESVIEGHENTEKLQIKNVCAKLHVSLVNRLDNTIGILKISKRQFIEYAIIQALDKADSIMEDFGVHDYLEYLDAKREQDKEEAA